MKIKVNLKTILALNPCENRLDNYREHYSKFSGDIIDFLELDKITARDKVWVACILIPRFEAEVFAIDCAMSAAAYAAAAAAAAADAAYAAAADAAYAAAYAADAAERERQIEALKYLIKGAGK